MQTIISSDENLGSTNMVFATKQAAQLWIKRCGDEEFIKYNIVGLRTMTYNDVKMLYDLNGTHDEDDE